MSVTDYPFPSGSVPTGTLLPSDAPSVAVDVDVVRSVLTGVYAGPLGSIVSHQFAPEGRISPCVYRGGGTCYGGTYNYFDPDSFLSILALLHSQDAKLWEQGKRIIETSRGMICRQTTEGLCTVGQMPHHFVDSCSSGEVDATGKVANIPQCHCQNNTVFPSMVDCVTFEALSGALQTGPAVFWIMASLKYAQFSGDVDWLQQAMPDLRLVLDTLLSQYDANEHLLNCSGSLFIDVFRRYDYTSDSNAGLVMLLQDFASAERITGNLSGAALLDTMRTNTLNAMNRVLWRGDHYVTQVDTNGTVRDFVDYDSNTLAVAAGVANLSQANAVFKRMDAGACTHSRGTYVSEIYYDAENCFLGNTGDSRVAMGRIAYYDALARHRFHRKDDVSMILNPLQVEQRLNSWMFERYNCEGQPTHNPYYIEYGEVTAIATVEAQYGIQITFETILIDPVDSQATFRYKLGQTEIARTPDAVSATFGALSGTRNVTIGQINPGTWTVTLHGASNPPKNCQGGTFTVSPSSPQLTTCLPVGTSISFTATRTN